MSKIVKNTQKTCRSLGEMGGVLRLTQNEMLDRMAMSNKGITGGIWYIHSNI